jgi:hypothetical protein
MWYSVAEYSAAVVVVAVIIHSVVRQFAVASVATAASSSIAYLIYGAWKADFQVKPGWVFPLFVAGFMFALPASFLGGIPHLLWRAHRRRGSVSFTGPVTEQVQRN